MGIASQRKRAAAQQAKTEAKKADKTEGSPALDMLAGLVNKQKPSANSPGGIVNTFKRTARH